MPDSASPQHLTSLARRLATKGRGYGTFGVRYKTLLKIGTD
jgi:hypothetical protein